MVYMLCMITVTTMDLDIDFSQIIWNGKGSASELFTDTAVQLIVCKALTITFIVFLILLYIIIRALMFLYYAVSYYVFGTWVWSSSISEWIYHPQIPFFTTSSYAISNLYNIINTMVRREEYFP